MQLPPSDMVAPAIVQQSGLSPQISVIISDVGKKAASVLPLLSQEAMQMTQEHVVTINPKL